MVVIRSNSRQYVGSVGKSGRSSVGLIFQFKFSECSNIFVSLPHQFRCASAQVSVRSRLNLVDSRASRQVEECACGTNLRKGYAVLSL